MLHKNALKLLFPIELDGDLNTDFDLEGSHLDAVVTRAEDFLTEMFPDEALELLTDWERVVSIPDDCIAVEAAAADRRINILSRIASYGGLSIPYFIILAANLGFTITIQEYHPFRVGIEGMGDFIRDPDFQFVWQVTVSAGGGYTKLECIFGKLKPAHTRVFFTVP